MKVCKNVVGGILKSGQFGTDAEFCVLVAAGITAATAASGPLMLAFGAAAAGSCAVAVQTIDNFSHCKEHPWECSDKFCHALGL